MITVITDELIPTHAYIPVPNDMYRTMLATALSRPSSHKIILDDYPDSVINHLRTCYHIVAPQIDIALEIVILDKAVLTMVTLVGT